MKEYFEINYKYSTSKRYKEYFSNIKKELCNYKLSVLTSYILNQALLKSYQTSSTKEALRNYQKVIKSSLRDATYYFEFIKNNQTFIYALLTACYTGMRTGEVFIIKDGIEAN